MARGADRQEAAWGRCQSLARPPGGRAAVRTSAAASPEAGVGWRLPERTEEEGRQRTLGRDSVTAERNTHNLLWKN